MNETGSENPKVYVNDNGLYEPLLINPEEAKEEQENEGRPRADTSVLDIQGSKEEKSRFSKFTANCRQKIQACTQGTKACCISVCRRIGTLCVSLYTGIKKHGMTSLLAIPSTVGLGMMALGEAAELKENIHEEEGFLTNIVYELSTSDTVYLLAIMIFLVSPAIIIHEQENQEIVHRKHASGPFSQLLSLLFPIRPSESYFFEWFLAVLAATSEGIVTYIFLEEYSHAYEHQSMHPLNIGIAICVSLQYLNLEGLQFREWTKRKWFIWDSPYKYKKIHRILQGASLLSSIGFGIVAFTEIQSWVESFFSDYSAEAAMDIATITSILLAPIGTMMHYALFSDAINKICDFLFTSDESRCAIFCCSLGGLVITSPWIAMRAFLPYGAVQEAYTLFTKQESGGWLIYLIAGVMFGATAFEYLFAHAIPSVYMISGINNHAYRKHFENKPFQYTLQESIKPYTIEGFSHDIAQAAIIISVCLFLGLTVTPQEAESPIIYYGISALISAASALSVDFLFHLYSKRRILIADTDSRISALTREYALLAYPQNNRTIGCNVTWLLIGFPILNIALEMGFNHFLKSDFPDDPNTALQMSEILATSISAVSILFTKRAIAQFSLIPNRKEEFITAKKEIEGKLGPNAMFRLYTREEMQEIIEKQEKQQTSKAVVDLKTEFIEDPLQLIAPEYSLEKHYQDTFLSIIFLKATGHWNLILLYSLEETKKYALYINPCNKTIQLQEEEFLKEFKEKKVKEFIFQERRFFPSIKKRDTGVWSIEVLLALYKKRQKMLLKKGIFNCFRSKTFSEEDILQCVQPGRNSIQFFLNKRKEQVKCLPEKKPQEKKQEQLIVEQNAGEELQVMKHVQ